MTNFSEWITVKTFNMSHESLVIKSFLESEDIECFVKDSLTVQIDPFYSNSLGGAKLQVREADYNRAIALLMEKCYLKKEDFKEDRGMILFMKLYNKFKSFSFFS